MRQLLSLLFVLAVLCPDPAAATPAKPSPTPEPYHGIQAKGRFLYDACGEKIILRGVNKMTIWTDRDKLEAFAEIAKTGANCVRIVWTTKDGTMAGLEKAVEKCAQHKMIPIIELHDYTCKWGDEAFNALTAYWTDNEIVAMVKKHEKYLIINYGNEMGDWQTDVEDYVKRYSEAIKKMRKAGIRVPVMIDAPKCGQDMNPFYAYFGDIYRADPAKNTIYSIHMWWPNSPPERVQDALMTASGMDNVIVCGDFAASGVGCAPGIPYKTILSECSKYEVGWLAWEWGPGNKDCSEMDMTKDNKFDSLYGWGKEVAVESEYSIKKTAKRNECLWRNGYKAELNIEQ
ncbi:MAG: glycoside hydrolase family 5 protein [Spirochaetia bacterium]|nr:glycoside hydrolase family 5 protein [Spirochaetia bacterium]